MKTQLHNSWQHQRTNTNRIVYALAYILSIYYCISSWTFHVVEAPFNQAVTVSLLKSVLYIYDMYHFDQCTVHVQLKKFLMRSLCYISSIQIMINWTLFKLSTSWVLEFYMAVAFYVNIILVLKMLTPWYNKLYYINLL